MFINSICAISPAGVLTTSALHLELTDGQGLLGKEPSYKDVIPPMQLRRMSKTLRTGVAAAKTCLQQADIEQPDSIHIGTAYGVLDDSEKFLDSIITNNEQTLTPTAFIQSTHNTVSGQIALSIGCNGHNMTFVHKGHSFESALLDAELLLDESNDAQALVGAVDELTSTSFEILKRFGVYSDAVKSGEGATFFTISNNKRVDSLAEIKAWEMFTANDEEDAKQKFQHFIDRYGIQLGNHAIIVAGGVKVAINELNDEATVYDFKCYSGEYPTAVAFGLAFAIVKMKEENRRGALLINRYGNCGSVYWLER